MCTWRMHNCVAEISTFVCACIRGYVLSCVHNHIRAPDPHVRFQLSELTAAQHLKAWRDNPAISRLMENGVLLRARVSKPVKNLDIITAVGKETNTLETKKSSVLIFYICSFQPMNLEKTKYNILS